MPKVPPDVVASLLDHKKSQDDEKAGAQEDLHSAAEDLLDSVKSGDADGLVDALRALLDLIPDSEPDEPDDGEPDSGEGQ